MIPARGSVKASNDLLERSTETGILRKREARKYFFIKTLRDNLRFPIMREIQLHRIDRKRGMSKLEYVIKRYYST